MKNEDSYTTADKIENPKVREDAFQQVYFYTPYSEIAERVSDDFGLIFDAQILGFSDPWLDKLIACYENSTVPYGEL